MSVTRSSRNLMVAMVALATSGVLVTSCSSDTATGTQPSLLSDSTATLDVATTSGDAVATAVEMMSANEVASSLSFDVLQSVAATNAFSVTRTKTCYDGAGAVVAACSPISTVRKIASLVTIDGTRGSSNTVTGGTSITWSGAVHRVSHDTTVRNFTTGTSTEVSRTHSDNIVGHDTTMFSDGTTTRNHVEATHDSVKGVTWNLPRSSNPFPISGSIVRVDSVHVTVMKANASEVRDRVHTVEVDFPADAQGNVVLKVDAKTCSLNLVTHVVSGCK